VSKPNLNRALRRSALTVALGICFASGVHAQSSTSGAVFGSATQGDTITVVNPQTGFSRTVTVDADGSFRLAALPVGEYTVTRRSAAGEEINRIVRVNAGTSATVSFVAGTDDVTSMETITVTGAAVNPIDVSSVESVTILTEAQIDRVPVQRNVTAVALLAPGTVRGDSRFGNLASFGGSSVAENVYYINGFNVTNIVSGLAFSQVPFEAIAEQQIKTGGYGAEFGRSLGGVINITTKQGTNEWEGGASAFWSPGSLNGDTRIAYDPDRDGAYDVVKTGTERDSLTYNLYGGGALVKDRLFFFGLFQGKKTDLTDNFQTGHEESTADSPQGLVKLDWYVNDNHRVELTAFRDENEITGTSFAREEGDQGIGGGTLNGDFNSKTGGDNYVAKWTGYMTDNLTLSALYGVGKYSRSSGNSNSVNCPVVVDARSTADVGPLGVTGCWISSLAGVPDAGDKRTAWRFDGEWALADHTIRFGLDREEFETVDGSQYSGGIYWRYVNTTPGQALNPNVTAPADATELVRGRFFGNGGTFLTKNDAWYIEDHWQVTDNLNLYAGIRNEGFTNLNSNGGSFIDVQNTWSPRLGFSWDARGDSTLKVFGNAGRYYIPVYANTNVRLAGAELDYQDWYRFTGIDPETGAPILGEQVGTRFVNSDGEVPDPRAVVDNNLSPMYQDEYIGGVQWQFAPKWTAGVRGIYRQLKSGMDDICTGAGAEAWALDNGYTADQAAAIGGALEHCFLTNPGNDLSANVDLDGTGELTVVEIPGSAIGIPEAERTYKAVELLLERAWDDKWFFQASYTWAKSEGNTEGYVKSDNGQDDAGITQDFDYPGLTDGAYGYLPNDRRHSLKLFGAYQLTEEFRVGANFLVQSGRPYNCFGIYPADGPDDVAPLYGVASFYCGEGTPYTVAEGLHPRGTSGRVPYVRTLDLQLAYEPKWAEGLNFRVDVSNVLDSDDYYRVDDNWDAGGGAKSFSYGHPRSYVAPRSVTFSVGYEF
jgi:hypothetical protein